MTTDGSDQAKTHLPHLLGRIERGEAIITRHANPVTRLVPVAPMARQPEIAEGIAAMRAFQEREAPILGNDLTIPI